MKELSELLRSERKRRNLTMGDVSVRTCLSVNALEALEAGDYERIGAPILIRGFVRAYCSALGMDPEPLLEKYAPQILAYDRQMEGIQRYGEWTRSLRKKKRFGLFMVLFTVVGIGGVLYGADWLSERQAHLAQVQQSMKGGYSQEDLPADLPAQSPANSSQPVEMEGRLSAIPGKGGETASTLAPLIQEPAPPAQTSSPAEVMAEDKFPAREEKPQKQVLSIEVDRTTWVQVRPDGKHARSVTLHSGEKREWEAKESAQVVLGSGSGVRVSWNGEPVEVAGKPGKVMRLHLPKSDGD